MTKVYTIVWIAGDGIGPELSVQVKRLAAATGLHFQILELAAGADALKTQGELLPQATLAALEQCKVALKGPLTTPIGAGFRSVNVALRKQLALYANVRPVKSIPNLSRYPQVDLVIVRENTEDLYAGLEHMVAPGVAESLKVITRVASLRIAEYAFAYAQAQGRRLVTTVHKANIMKLTDGLFLDCAREVASQYPQIEHREMIADNACMQLVTRPEQFDIILTQNLYGDLLSDLCAGLVGGLGVVPGANIGQAHAIFEAVHGSAPDIAGQGKANPSALMLSFAMLLRYLGEAAIAARLEAAVWSTLQNPATRTADLGGALSTSEFGDEVIRHLLAIEGE